MSALRDLQRGFRDVLLAPSGDTALGADSAPWLGTVATDGLAATARLAIYRHHVATTLTDALAATFPVVRRLVSEPFFAFAADRFISAHPPASPCLHEYGDAFPAFLASFEPCRELVYLPDVARLEWAMCVAEHADELPPLQPDAVAAIPPHERHGLRFTLHPAITLLASPWPIDRIWRANQPDADPQATVDLGTGAIWLEVRRHGDDVVWRRLTAGAYALRDALHGGRTLGEAADAALAAQPALDVAAAVSALLHDDTLVAFTLNP